MMKKMTAFFCVAMIMCILVYPSKSVYAESPLNITIQTETMIKPDKAFTVSVVFQSDEEIGAVQACLEYDSSLLTASSVTFRDKIKEDVFQYSVQDGVLRFVFSGSELPCKERIVDIRFRPQESGSDKSYCFTLTDAAVCNDEGEQIPVQHLPEMNVTVKEDETVTSQEQLPVTENKGLAIISSGFSSKRTSKEAKNVSLSSDNVRSQGETAETSPDTIIIREKENNPVITQGWFLCLLGIILIVGGIAFNAFWAGVQKANKK